MSDFRIRTALGRALNGLLRPTGLALGRRETIERATRATYVQALAHLKRAGFVPRSVIDVGAAGGTMPLYEAFPEARLVLIEPVAEAWPYLDAIATRYLYVDKVRAALAERPGPLVLNVHRDIARTSPYWESDYDAEAVTVRQVPATTLDRVRSELDLPAPILLKIDVQGAELDVLEGASKTLRDTEYVIVETSLFEFFRGAPQLSDVIEHMRQRGFVPYDVLAIQYRPLDGAVSQLDLAFVKTVGKLRSTHRFQAGPMT